MPKVHDTHHFSFNFFLMIIEMVLILKKKKKVPSYFYFVNKNILESL